MSEFTTSDGVQLRGPALQSLVATAASGSTMYVEYVDKNGYTCSSGGQTAYVFTQATAGVRVTAMLTPPSDAAGVIVACSAAFNWNQSGAITGANNAVNTTSTALVLPNGARGTVAASTGLRFGPGATGRIA